MSLTASVILRQAYARIGGWKGDPQEINAQYNADMDFEQVVSESFPPQSMWDLLTAVENEMAVAVGMSEDSVLRRVIHDTATVTSGGLIPSTGDSGGSIVGNWGQVRDAVTGMELTPGLHLDEISATVNGPTGLFKSTLHSFALRPPRIYATVSSLSIDVCTFNYASRASLIMANDPLLFQQCANAYFSGLMAYLKNQDPMYSDLSALYMPIYQQWLASPQSSKDVVEVAAA